MKQEKFKRGKNRGPHGIVITRDKLAITYEWHHEFKIL